MKIIRLAYASMWPNMAPSIMPQDYFFEYVLSQYYNVVYDQQSPDVLIYSVFGDAPDIYSHNPHTLRIAYSGEVQDPQGPADLFLGFHNHNTPYYHRLPLWALYTQWDNLKAPYAVANNPLAGQGSHHVNTSASHVTDPLTHPMRMSNLLTKHTRSHSPTKFCNFTYSRPSKDRIEFFLQLNRYKKIHSTGAVYNNTGYRLGNKVLELADWKFTIAFENTVLPGYVTEKLIEPLAAGSVPIYAGGEMAVNDFNPQAFIRLSDFQNWDDAIGYIKLVDSNLDLYNQYLEAPVFKTQPNYPQTVFDWIYPVLIKKNPTLTLT